MTLDRATMEAVRRLRPDKRNARTHSKKQIKQLANVILRYGWTYPILIDENCNIICGHARWEAAKELRIKAVPVIVMSGLSDAEKLALAIADNKIAANAGWDRKLLAAELGELASLLPACNLELEITGFEPAEIDSLVADFGDAERDPVDEPVKVADRPVSRKGDLWQSGPHRLLCGDACDEPCLATLMGRDRAAMIFADPPYNVHISRGFLIWSE
jgi:ParB-like chromosome segregation protein Spo0J